MRVLLALAAVVSVAAATVAKKPAGCKSDRGCDREYYCAKPDNQDGTTRVGFCTVRPSFGDRCGSERNGLTQKCLDGLLCTGADEGCCGSCSTTRASTTHASTTRAATSRVADTTRAATTTAATTRAASTAGFPIEYTKNNAICGGVKLNEFDNRDTGLGFDVLSKFDKKKNNYRFQCEKRTQTCWAVCKPTSGFVYRGTVQVRCDAHRGWVVLGNKCQRHKNRAYGRKTNLAPE